MPRKNLIRTNQSPYHIVTRSNHKKWFRVDMNDLWSAINKILKQTHDKYPFQLHSFVLMSNHYHMVIETPDSNIDLIMYEFNKNLSLFIRQSSGMENKMFGKRYHWSIIKDRAHYYNVMKYVYQNPIRAGIIDKAEHYRYSTLCRDKKWGEIQMFSYQDFGISEVLNWINHSFSQEEMLSIKSGLKKKEFNYAYLKGTKKRPFTAYDEKSPGTF